MRRAEPQSPPPRSLKLAPSTFILLGNFVTLHFETAYIFPPCCIILKKKKKKIGRKKKKQVGVLKREKRGSWKGEEWVGRVAVARHSLYLGLSLTPPPPAPPPCTNRAFLSPFDANNIAES